MKGNFITDAESFRWVADQMSYVEKVRSGRFEIEPGWNNRELVQHLRAGKQAPVKVVLNNERLLEDVAAKVSGFIEPDSLALLQAFLDPAYLQQMGYAPETVMSLFVPNTYEMYWNSNPTDFLNRMLKEHNAFWEKRAGGQRRQPWVAETQVYTLASIVDRETNNVG
ncbi:MAG: endolytic transglycosylase MltG [Lewinellaceae bacterium]|nr:endolytic transglycosylase MltG [Lewinellaceae bacterium]